MLSSESAAEQEYESRGGWVVLLHDGERGSGGGVKNEDSEISQISESCLMGE